MKKWRKFLKRYHPEGIHWPATLFYNAISSRKIFQQHYDLVAQDILLKGPIESVLDIGMGPGWLLLAFRKVCPSIILYGADVSPSMVEAAKRNLVQVNQYEEIDLQVCRAENLPYPDESFDCVVSTGSLHHWKDSMAGLNEVHRVLKAGHSAYIYDLVRKLPKDISREAKKQFGFVQSSLLWLHSFEEPFLDSEEMLSLGKNSFFHSACIRYVGALCCLELHKQ